MANKGTQNRIKEHCQSIKETLRQLPDVGTLVEEYIKEVDPEYDVNVWSKFKTTTDAIKDFKRWAGVVEAPTTESKAKLIPGNPSLGEDLKDLGLELMQLGQQVDKAALDTQHLEMLTKAVDLKERILAKLSEL